MPICKKCGYDAASSYFRRSPKGGHLCLDREACRDDAKIRRRGGTPGPRSLAALLRLR